MSEETTEAQRARALAILEGAHSFPGPFSFTVITLARQGVTDELRALAGTEGLALFEEHFVVTGSSSGKYLSHRMLLHVPHAESVLDFYERLRSLEGVVQLL